VGYLVETSGRILLPESLERQAVTVLEVRMDAQQGWFDADDPTHAVHTVADLGAFAAADVRREGDWLLLATDTEGDPKWSEQASTFYRTLGSFVRDGEVHVRGEDGQVWSYVYSGDGVVQRGDNGWDGTPGDAPGAAPVPEAAAPPTPTPPGVVPPEATQPSEFTYPGSEDRPTPPPQAQQPPPAPLPYAGGAPDGPGVPDYRAERAWAEPAPASAGRTALMVALLVMGVILIIGLALVVSGL
jgi:hypothetical protein